MDLVEIIEKCSDWFNPDLDCPALPLWPAKTTPLDPDVPSIWPVALAVTVLCCALVFVGITIRTFTRIYILKAVQVDDVLIVMSSAGLGAFVGILLRAFRYGMSKHQWNVAQGDLSHGLRHMYAAQIVYCIAMYAAKTGILLQIRRIFTGPSSKLFYRTSWALILLLGAAYASALLITVFSCNPRAKFWNLWLPGKCNARVTTYLNGAVNLASDVVVLALPIFGVVQLQMTLRKKIAVCIVFATGMLACIASAVQLSYNRYLLGNNDVTYWLAVVSIWAAVELAAVILCACLPTFPRFYAYLRGIRTGSEDESGVVSRSAGPSRIVVRREVTVATENLR